MHVFGGFLAGNMILIGRQISLRSRGVILPQNSSALFVALLGGLLVGILWEIIEFWFGVSKLGPNFITDTITDLSMDVVGAFIAYITWIKIPHKTT